MIEALTVLYSQAPNVKAAYLALVNGLYDSGQDSLLLGLEVDGDPEPIVNDTSAVIHDTYRDAYSIDIVEVWVDDEGTHIDVPTGATLLRSTHGVSTKCANDAQISLLMATLAAGGERKMDGVTRNAKFARILYMTLLMATGISYD